MIPHFRGTVLRAEEKVFGPLCIVHAANGLHVRRGPAPAVAHHRASCLRLSEKIPRPLAHRGTHAHESRTARSSCAAANMSGPDRPARLPSAVRSPQTAPGLLEAAC